MTKSALRKKLEAIMAQNDAAAGKDYSRLNRALTMGGRVICSSPQSLRTTPAK